MSLHGGTCFKVRYSRAGQSFEFPILLTGDARDWELFVAATVLPPLTSWLFLRCARLCQILILILISSAGSTGDHW